MSEHELGWITVKAIRPSGVDEWMTFRTSAIAAVSDSGDPRCAAFIHVMGDVVGGLGVADSRVRILRLIARAEGKLPEGETA